MKKNLIGAAAAAVLMAAAVMGCGAGTAAQATTAAVTAEAVTAAAETTAAETAAETTEAAAAAEGMTTEAAAETAAEQKLETYEGDGWSITYDTELFAAKKMEEGVLITYMGESTAPHYIAITDDGYKTPEEALANLGGRDLTDPAESTFMGQKALFRMTKDNGASEGVVEVFTAFEHNGKVTSIEQRSPIEKDEEKAMTISDTMEAMVQTFTVTD